MISINKNSSEVNRAFLDHFDPTQRGVVNNHFLAAVRAGAQTPEQVVRMVIHQLEFAIRRDTLYRQQYGRATEDQNTTRKREVLNAIAEYTEEALDEARWAIAWEKLTPAQKEQARRERAQPHIQTWMQGQPPSQRQLGYLAGLGYSGTQPATMADASALIDRLKRARSQPWTGARQ
jgi:hypothetical protein